jgi:hypothetical protein
LRLLLGEKSIQQAPRDWVNQGGPPWHGSARYATTPGGRPTILPQAARIWVASTVGKGERTLTWPVRSGSWTLVVMNADGRPGVTADAAIGARLSFLGWVAGGLLAAGAVVAALTTLLLVLALRRRSDPHPAMQK